MEEQNKISPPHKRDIIDSEYTLRHKLLVIAGAAASGLIFDNFFFSREVGISYPIFALILIAFFTAANYKEIAIKRPLPIIFFVLVLFLSLPFGIISNRFLKFLDFITVPFLMCLFTIAVSNKETNITRPSTISKMFRQIFYYGFLSYFKPFKFLAASIRNSEGIKNSSAKKNIAIGILISFFILIIVLPMLASADMAFGYYLRNLSKALEIINGETLFHIILVTVMSLYFFSYVWSFRYSRLEDNTQTARIPIKAAPMISVTVLVILNVTYLLFTMIQFSYLYSGASNVLPLGFTYAEYARRGFFELVKVSVINQIIIITILKFTDTSGRSKVNFIRMLLTVTVLFTGNMLISAFFRMSLYESAYGITSLRLYVYIFMLFQFVILVLSLLKIFNDKIPLFTCAVAAALIFLVCSNYINIDRIIASRTISHFEKTGKIDTEYLYSLSDDAAPYIAGLSNSSNPKIASIGKEYISSNHKENTKDYSFLEYNYSRERADKIRGSR